MHPRGSGLPATLAGSHGDPSRRVSDTLGEEYLMPVNRNPPSSRGVAMGDGIVSAKWIGAYFSGVIKTSTLSPVESKLFMKAATFSGVSALTVFS